MSLWFCNLLVISSLKYTTSSPSFPSGIVEWAKREITPREKGDDFHARSRFARSIIPEEKVKDYSSSLELSYISNKRDSLHNMHFLIKEITKLFFFL